MAHWLEIARAELGVHEYADGDHPRILGYLATVDVPGELHDEIPWCSGFANWVMDQAGYVGTGSAAARSWLSWGKPIGWPKIGAIVVLRRGDNTWQGHVGFVTGIDAGRLLVLGGNQANAVNVRSYPFDRVIGYRWPEEPNGLAIDMLPIETPPEPVRRKWWEIWRPL